MSDAPQDEEGHDAPMPEGEEPPPPGVKAMAMVRWAILGLTIALAAFVWIAWIVEKMAPTKTTAAGSDAVVPKYHCPMHPQIVSNEPGECPICHMDLVPIGGGTAPLSSSSSAGAPKAAKPLVILDDSGASAFFCPMDPEIRSAKPGRCPICKMALEPIPDGGAGATAMAEPGSIPPGTAPIKLALDRVQSIGVRTALVSAGSTSAVLRATAIVQPSEQGAAEVHVRTPGFVEAIHVDQTGRAIGMGQPLFSLYSPEIFQAQHEMLVTHAWGDAGIGLAPNAARSKLELLGMMPADIDRVIAKHEPLRAIAIVAPRGGYVTKKNIVLGSYVTPEMMLYEIQDLSRVYVVADLFLRDFAHVKVGSPARFVPNGRAGTGDADGKIDLVYPVANVEARTRRVRMQIESKADRRYAPGEFGVVEIKIPERKAVTIPRDALIDSGSASYVFIAEHDGEFVPRTIATSGSEGDRVIVDSGLTVGDRVVSGATFLIDSESRLQASIRQATPAAPTGSGPGK